MIKVIPNQVVCKNCMVRLEYESSDVNCKNCTEKNSACKQLYRNRPDKVYAAVSFNPSDVKKALSWYNLLLSKDLIDGEMDKMLAERNGEENSEATEEGKE